MRARASAAPMSRGGVYDPVGPWAVPTSPAWAIAWGGTDQERAKFTPVMPAQTRRVASARPSWSLALRALREARGVTQEGWAALLGVGYRTVQRWEQGGAPPDAATEVTLLAYCEEQGLLRAYAHGPLAGPPPTRASLAALLADARLSTTRAETERWADAPVPLAPRRSAPPLTSLIGRDGDVASVLEQLRDARLVTLTGPAGTGKTRLAQAVATAYATDAPEGAVFIALATITDPALVLPTIGQAFGLGEYTTTSMLAVLAEALHGRALLLVLDNMEQLLEAAGDVAELLGACPRLTVLVTSRAPLRVRGERVVPVQPLPIPERGPLPSPDALARVPAVQLFCERGRDVRPAFALTAENAAVIVEICRRLDGLPLALELAAAQLRLFTPRALLARLDRRLALLTVGPRDLPARQRTLRGTIAWSYDLLTPAERSVFRRLAVFVGGCTLPAAEAVCRATDGPDGDVVHNVAALVEQSLLQPNADMDGEPRVAMLETIREFGWEQLTARGELDAARRRHAEHYLALAEAVEPHLREAGREPWFGILAAERDNLRAALGWSLDQGEPQLGMRLVGALLSWFIRERPSEGRRWAQELLALPAADAAVTARARALTTAGAMAYHQGDLDAARQFLEEGVTLWRRADPPDRFWLALALAHLGISMRESFAAARGHAEEALSLFRALGSSMWIATALRFVGMIAAQMGDLADARRHSEESLALARRVGDPRGIAQALLHIGGLALRSGDHAGAGAALDESLSLFRAIGDRPSEAMVLERLGRLAEREGDSVRAAVRFAQALPLHREAGNLAGVAACRAGLAATDAIREPVAGHEQ